MFKRMAVSAVAVAAIIARGSDARAQGPGAVQVGGAGNQALGEFSVAVGGVDNVAYGNGSVVTGGLANWALTFGAAGGGALNFAGDYGAIAGGFQNRTGTGGAVAGGSGNVAGDFASVGGGYLNSAAGLGAHVGGGAANSASGMAATVLGGVGNSASGELAAVLSGRANFASGRLSTVVSGVESTASAEGAVLIADGIAPARNETDYSLLMSFPSGGILSHGVQSPVSMPEINVTRDPVTSSTGGATAPGPIDVVLPTGSNVVRFVNHGIDITNTPGSFTVARMTRNQTVWIQRIVPVLRQGTRLTVYLDSRGVPSNSMQRQSMFFFRDAKSGTGATSPFANLQLGTPVSPGADLSPSSLTTTYQQDSSYRSFFADNNDVIDFISDGTYWVQVSASRN